MKALIRLVTLVAIASVSDISAAQNEPSSLVKDGLVALTIESPGRCYIADLDLIAMELHRDTIPRKRLIATIEALPGNNLQDVPTGSALISHHPDGPATDTVVSSFTVPLSNMPKRAVVAGLFICKDGDNDGKCVNNAHLPFADMVKEHHIEADAINQESGLIEEGKEPETRESPDRIYFFRPIVINPHRVLAPAAANSDEYTTLLRTYLAADPRTIEWISTISSNLGSLPLEGKEDSLVVTLPHYESRGCFTSPS